MQTFLPYPSGTRSARVLDTQRLGKQRIECLQILATLTNIYKTEILWSKVPDLVPGSISEAPPVLCTHAGEVWAWNPHRTGGWLHHPAVIMWEGYEAALVEYSLQICAEWIYRGYRDTTAQTISMMADLSIQLVSAGMATRGVNPRKFTLPAWWGSDSFHTSHQSNLLRKDPEHYGQYFPEVSPDLPYVWPPGKTRSAPSTRTRYR